MKTIRKPVASLLIQMCEKNTKPLMFKNLVLSFYSLMLILLIFKIITITVLTLVLPKSYSL